MTSFFRFKSPTSSPHHSRIRDPLSVLSCQQNLLYKEENNFMQHVSSVNPDFSDKLADFHKEVTCENSDIKNYLQYERCRTSNGTGNISPSTFCGSNRVKEKPSSLESDSLLKLKNRLKIEMKKEYWKRENLKRDFLKR